MSENRRPLGVGVWLTLYTQRHTIDYNLDDRSFSLFSRLFGSMTNTNLGGGGSSKQMRPLGGRCWGQLEGSSQKVDV